MTNTASKNPADKIAAQCIKRARTLLGPGWQHVSREIRRGLVSSEILRVVQAGAGVSGYESMTAAVILDYLRELTVAADAILGAETGAR